MFADSLLIAKAEVIALGTIVGSLTVMFQQGSRDVDMIINYIYVLEKIIQYIK